MSSEITTEAVRLALGMHEMQARIASINIANASRPDARAMRFDFSSVQTTLADVSQVHSMDVSARLQQANIDLRAQSAQTTSDPISADEQIGDMVAAGANFQALSEALSRYFGLMRLAATGRS